MEGPTYRKNLAEKLSQTPKDDRLEVLRYEKVDERYLDAHARHSLEVQNGVELRKVTAAAKKAKTLDELEEILASTPFLVWNNNSGHDHSEHAAKRVHLSRILQNTNHIPNTEIKEIVESLLQKEGVRIQPEIVEEDYLQYLNERFRAFGLSDVEIATLAVRLPPEVFCSLDSEIEAPIVLLNLLPETTTNFSCAGHRDGGWFDAAHGYIAFNTKDDELIDELKQLEMEDSSFEVSLDNIGDRTILSFNKKVPVTWLKTHNRKTEEEIFAESKMLLSRVLGDEILMYAKADRDFYGALFRLQKRKLQKREPADILKPYAPNTRLWVEIEKLTPSSLIEREHGDYYSSDASEAEKHDFINKLTATLTQYRQKHLPVQKSDT